MATSNLKPTDPEYARWVDPATGEYRVIEPGQTFKSITDKITRIVLTPHTPMGWFAVFALAGSGATVLLVAVTWLFLKGVGIWAITQPVAWGFAIINFVWWIGIGHAGTLISAILLLFKQQWRNSISRFAEAMTIFAVVCAGMFPLIHVGRPWLGYWMLPLPYTMTVWPQFRSPLEWDVFAVSTYATISVVFWYVGMVPDFGTFRDRAKSKVGQYFYGIISLGWRGSVRHWMRYETASLLLAGLATPLVLSVHTVISFDFAVAVLPGWHTTIFPPYFVAGAIYSGFAMVLTLAIPLRKFYRLEALVTERHIDNMGKVMLATGFIVAYGYGMEAFMAWYSASHWEAFMFWNRDVRPHGVELLDADPVQPGHPPDHAVVAQAEDQHQLHVHHFHRGQHGHVVRALRDHRDQPVPRLSALLVGHLPGDEVGLHDVHRHAGAVHHPVRLVRALSAHDPHERAAHAGAPGQDPAQTAQSGSGEWRLGNRD